MFGAGAFFSLEGRPFKAAAAHTTVKAPENVGEAISFPQTFGIVRREDSILPYIGTRLSSIAAHTFVHDCLINERL